MNAPHQTQYIADGSAPVVTLAQARANEIAARLECDLRPEVERLDEAITRKTEQLHANWQTHANEPARAGLLQRDLEQLHRDRELARAIVAGAERELEVAQRQVIADRGMVVRAAADAHMLGTLAIARQIVDHMAGSALLYRELLQRREDLPTLFSHDRSQSVITPDEAMQPMKHTNLQDGVDRIFATLLQGKVGNKWTWDAERPPLGYPAGSENRLVDLLEGERFELLRAIDAAIGQVTSTGTLGKSGSIDTHAQSMAETQARAARAGA